VESAGAKAPAITISIQQFIAGLEVLWVLVQFFEGRQTEPISTSPYAASTASHTCRIMAPGPMISDVSNGPFLILFAISIPLNVISAFPNVLNHGIG